MRAPHAEPSVGYPNSDERPWVLIAHYGAVGGFLAALVVLLAKGNESRTVRAHAVEAVNFQITWFSALLVAAVISVCSLDRLFALIFIPWLMLITFGIIGGRKANEGQLYRYPASIRIVT